MKYLVISDIHGSYYWLKKALKAFTKFKCDKILILGDILYHGPRNNLPRNYSPKKCIALLNPLKDRIISVKGNCDAYVDEIVLDFKLNDRITLDINDKSILCIHGHLLDTNAIEEKYIMHGHTHINKVEVIDNKTIINFGSIALPKDKIHSFGIIENNNINIYDFKYKLIKNIEL